MNRRELLVRGTATLGLASLAMPSAWGRAAAKRRMLFYTRSAGFEHSTVRREGDSPAFAEKLMSELGPQHGYDVTVTKDGSVFDEDLAKFDVLFFYTTGDLTKPTGDKQPPMSADGKKRFLDAVAAGKGFVGSHCASDTFHSEGPARERQNPPDPFIAMLGGEFVSHGAQQEAGQVVASAKFPGCEGLGTSYRMLEEWYALKNFADDMHVILVQETAGMQGGDYERPKYPATWARKHHDGHVFYTSMGHREDVWTNPIFQGVLFGGLAWACRDAEADVSPNLREITPEAHTLKA